MSIHFSEDLSDFLPVFDDQCNRILKAADPEVFYSLYSEFIDKLSANTLVGPGLDKAESESQKKELEFNALMLKAVNDNLTRFAKYHTLKYKKKLVAIRKMIRQSDIISQTPFHRRIVSALEQFVKNSPFCRVMRKSLEIFQTSQEEFYDWLKDSCYVKQKHELGKKFSPAHITNQKFSGKIFDAKTYKTPPLFHNQVEWISRDLNLFTPKSLNINHMIETDIAFCWHKMRLLQKCWLSEDPVSLPKPYKGKWNSIKDAAWKSAIETDLKLEVLRTKQQIKKERLPYKDLISIRKNCEKLLKALRHHIHSEVCQIKNKKTEPQALSQRKPNLTQANTYKIDKENRVIAHAPKYWADFPLASYQEVFADYKKNHPKEPAAYSITKWKKIVQDHRLDPRTDEEKKIKSGRPPSKTRSQK